jgi:hypothetical protein
MSGLASKTIGSGRAFVPTEEQQAVAQAAGGTSDSLMVTAYAGCSKTTTLQLMGERIKAPALALAFNKKIAKELEPRFGQNWTVKTINGLGHGAWSRTVDKKIELDDRKLGKLVTEAAKDRKMELTSEQWSDTRQLVSKVMQAGITPGDQGEPLTEDTREAWKELAEDHLWLTGDEFDYLYDLAREVLERSISLARSGIISFDDQIYCPTVLGGKWARFPEVAVDEAQDMSPLNHRMLQLSLRDDGRLTAVGDPKQAIYAFRGADSQSMGKIRGLRQKWRDLPLTMTFRCPKVVVARQQGHAPGFRAYSGNQEGRFHKFQAPEAETLEGGWNYQSLTKLLPTRDSSIVVLCRNNGPLLALAFKLLRGGTGVFMLGRDIGKGLETLSKKILPEDRTPADICAGKIAEWQQHETTLAIANGKDERVAGIVDRAECLFAVLQGAEVKDAGDLRAMLKRLFAPESGTVTLSSIHRAKGLEWDLVVHLDPWRIPSKWAKQAAQAGDTGQLQQERNLLYVAETRSKHTLVEGNLEDWQS